MTIEELERGVIERAVERRTIEIDMDYLFESGEAYTNPLIDRFDAAHARFDDAVDALIAAREGMESK